MFSDKDWVATAAVEASPDDVFDALVKIRRDEMRALGSAYDNALSIDRKARSITVTGHWWYRGTHVVSDHPSGAVVKYQVKNIGGPVAYLDKPFYRKTMLRDLNSLLSEIAARLSCEFGSSS